MCKSLDFTEKKSFLGYWQNVNESVGYLKQIFTKITFLIFFTLFFVCEVIKWIFWDHTLPKNLSKMIAWIRKIWCTVQNPGIGRKNKFFKKAKNVNKNLNLGRIFFWKSIWNYKNYSFIKKQSFFAIFTAWNSTLNVVFRNPGMKVGINWHIISSKQCSGKM